MKNQTLKELDLALQQTFPKVYIRTISKLLEKLDNSELSPQEKEAIRLLTFDLRDLKRESTKKKNHYF